MKTQVDEPESDEFVQWKSDHEASDHQVRFHDLGESKGDTIWLAWEGDEWCDIYFDRNGKRVHPNVIEVD